MKEKENSTLRVISGILFLLTSVAILLFMLYWFAIKRYNIHLFHNVYDEVGLSYFYGYWEHTGNSPRIGVGISIVMLVLKCIISFICGISILQKKAKPVLTSTAIVIVLDSILMLIMQIVVGLRISGVFLILFISIILYILLGILLMLKPSNKMLIIICYGALVTSSVLFGLFKYALTVSLLIVLLSSAALTAFLYSKTCVQKEKPGLPQAAAINQDTNLVGKADAIKDLKELLDLGIITQEEFDKKKKELLG